MRILVKASICVMLFLMITDAAVSQGGPNVLSFQGYLTNGLGEPLDSSGVGITFRLYKNGTNIWMEGQTVNVTDGVFHVLLGNVAPLDTVQFDQALDLGIELVGEGAEMVPRTMLAAGAYAKALPGFYTFYRQADGYGGYNVVGGASNNGIGAGVVGGTISGGGGVGNGQNIRNAVSGHFGTVGGGANNTASGFYATVAGGGGNIASGSKSIVAGGFLNKSTKIRATVSGGEANSATGDFGTVGGGSINRASGKYATVGGGAGNSATGDGGTIAGGGGNAAGVGSSVSGGGDNTANLGSSVGGGYRNTANGNQATIGGGQNNLVEGDDATVGGGDGNEASGPQSTVGGGKDNEASGAYALVGGGRLNNAFGTRATISGGELNVAGGYAAAVGGGGGNKVNGTFAVVPGGWLNSASGAYSLAAGYRARANHEGSYVWNDRSVTAGDDSLVSTKANQYLIRAKGGVGINTNETPHPFQVGTNPTDGNGAHLTAAGVWKTASSREWKTNFREIDRVELLRKLMRMPVTRWKYREETEVDHIGPVAEDFMSAFGLGSDDRYIGSVDASGVALAAIQGLYQLVTEQQAEIERMRLLLARAGLE